MDNTTTSTVEPPAVPRELDEELAAQIVERAQTEGLELTGPNERAGPSSFPSWRSRLRSGH